MARRDRGTRTPRTYRSPQRTAQARRTRADILTAAVTRFVDTGYAATTMRSIADAAGVSLPTVELAFATKANLLKAAIDFAIAGDDEPVPMLNRNWAVAAHQAPAPADVVARFARALREAHTRSASLIIVADEAARTDDAIAALTRHLTQQRVATVTWIIDELRQRTPLRSGITRKQAIDVLWLLMEPYTFHRLTTLRGWNARQFERWFVDSACRLVLPGHDG